MKQGNRCGRVLGHESRHVSYETLEWKKNWRREKRRNNLAYNQMPAETYADRVLFIEKIKLESGCMDCGYNRYPEALDFDHLPGEIKEGNIAQMVNYSMERLLREIAKCEVVCSNCHRHRTRVRGYVRTPRTVKD